MKYDIIVSRCNIGPLQRPLTATTVVSNITYGCFKHKDNGQSHRCSWCLVLTQCRSLRDWVCGGPPCHQLKPREETMSVTFPTAFNRSCFACSAPSSDPGTGRDDGPAFKAAYVICLTGDRILGGLRDYSSCLMLPLLDNFIDLVIHDTFGQMLADKLPLSGS